jgi:S-(hydroxymethyl)glutathione dehydrogenase/alcohol dehydrogenase
VIKAAILYELNKPLVIKTIKPSKLIEGQVLVKIFFSGVCRSQLMEVEGGRGDDPWLPHLLGHEATGEVIEIGKNVKKVKIGDKVILGWIKGEGIDAEGAKYLCGDQIINSGKVSTFSNFSVVSENRLTKLPESIPLDQGVLFGCALLTGAGMVYNELKPMATDSVAVLGLGGIGLSAIIALKDIGCKNIIAIDVNDDKLSFAKELGANYFINPKNSDPLTEVKNNFKEGIDCCVESAGKIETIELGFSLLNKTGKLIFASHPPDGEFIKLSPHELISGKNIVGSWGGGCCPDKDIPAISFSCNRNNVPLDKLITKKYKLEEINDALNDLKKGNVFRPLICMEHSKDDKF